MLLFLSMKILIQYLKGYWQLVVLALLLAAVNQIFSLLDPWIFQKIIDKYVIPYNKSATLSISTKQFLQGAGFLIIAAMGVAMVSRIAKAFQDYYVNVITQKLGAQIYTDGLKHSLDLPFQAFEDQSSGETLGVLQKVRSDVEKLISAFVNILFMSIIGIIFVVFYAIKSYWVIAPVYFLTVPLLGILSSVLSKKIKNIQRSIVGQTTALSGSTTESLRNIELVKSLGLADQETKRLNNTTNKILDLELKKVKYIRSLSFIQGTCVNFLRNSILLLMLYLIFADKLTVGEFFSLFIYSFFIFGPLQELGNVINIYREAEVSLDNFGKILQSPKEKKPVNAIRIPAIDKINFEQVGYRHSSANDYALKNINFSTAKGNTVAFVGPSGSGKSTLVKLLIGLYKPQEGAILYNDVTGDEVDLDKLREQIGFVSQDTQLFAGTIRENLKFVAPDATDDDCTEALKKASALSILTRSDKQLDTIIGEGGMKLSGGEKQRLSIARALLRKPSLLVFDEATSALDSITEDEITKTLRTIAEEKKHITIMVAHRLSTIMHADTIYVLEKGRIIESGKHETLVEEKGLYYAMWRQQIGER